MKKNDSFSKMRAGFGWGDAVSVSMGARTVRSRLPHGSPERVGASALLRWFVAGIIAADLAGLAVGSLLSAEEFRAAGWDLLAWTAAVAVVGFVSIQTTSGQQLGMDMPLLLAVGFLHGPIVAGVVAFAGFVDVRELRGGISLTRALFNRAQTSLSVIVATIAFSLVGARVGEFPLVAFGALLAVGVDSLINYGLVISVLILNERSSVRACLGRLRIGSLSDFSVTYLSFGLLSVLLVEVHLAVGYWGLVLFMLPLLLGRKAFFETQTLEGARRRIHAQRQVVEEATSQIANERRDERLAVASGLHDDVLPPIFKVHLMGQVLSQDLASGRLLALEEDVPELIRATDEASEAMRTVIRSLRASPLGTGGLAQMLQLLVRHLEEDSPSLHFVLDVHESGGTPLVQLLAYQAAREALRNALRHSGASVIRLSLFQDGEDVRLVVEDDGVGFNRSSVDQDRHFGLALMRERVELAGGVMQVDTAPGEGTRLIVRLPSGRWANE